MTGPGVEERGEHGSDPAAPPDLDPADAAPFAEGEEAVELAVTDVLDLHSFPPREIRALVRDYLDLAYEEGIYELRIIHGKGIGVQRRSVRSLLEADPRVLSFGDAHSDGGSWGATVVRLRPPSASPGGSPGEG